MKTTGLDCPVFFIGSMLVHISIIRADHILKVTKYIIHTKNQWTIILFHTALSMIIKFFYTKFIRTYDYHYPIKLIFCIEELFDESLNGNSSYYRHRFKRGPNRLNWIV